MAKIFEEFSVGSMTARNRLVRSATAESLCTKEGQPTAPLYDAMVGLGEGGVGTIVTGFAYFCEDGKPAERALNFCPHTFEGDFRHLAEGIHGTGARAVLQLVYGGSKSKLAAGDPRWLPAAGDPNNESEPTARVLGPSCVKNPATGIVPESATAEDLDRLVRGFADGAARALACGFDGVEIHCAHGYLLSQFLSPAFNKRTDEFGGSIENRSRLLVQCVEAARAATRPDFPVFVKLNSCDAYDDPEGARGGLSEQDSARAAYLMQQAGASLVEVSGDWHAATKVVHDHQPYFGAFGARLARELEIPVMVTGGWRNPRIIEAHLAADGIEAVGLSRPLIREPYLPNRWAEGSDAPSLCQQCDTCQKFAGTPCPYRM